MTSEHAPRPAEPAPPLRRGRLRRALVLAALVSCGVLLALSLALVGGWQALGTEAGTAWLLSHMSGLKITGGRGSLRGGPYAAARVEFSVAGSPTRVRIEDLSWRDLHWHWRPHAGLWGGLAIDGLQARRIEVKTGGATGGPAKPPATLALPFELALLDARVGQLQVNDVAPMEDIVASLHLSAEGGQAHVVDRLEFRWDRVQVQANGRIATSGALSLSLQAVLKSRAPEGSAAAQWPRWQAQLRASGPLARMALQAQLRALEGTDGAALDLQAQVLPFAPWPLAHLAADLRRLDLAALASGLPQTLLDGHAAVASQAMDRPAQVDVRLSNAHPGRWDEGRLPVLSLAGTLRATPSDRGTLDIPSIDLVAGSAAARPAGRLHLSGRWSGSQLEAQADIAGLQPAALDQRAPAMVISGPVHLRLKQAGGDWQAAVDTRLTGQLAQPGMPAVEVRLDAEGSRQGERLAFELRELKATAAGAQAEAVLRIQRDGAAPWHVAGHGSLSRFDPLPWWPGPPDSAWRQGGHRLDGRWEADLTLPGEAADAAALLRASRGQARVILDDSRLAGVAVQGEVSLRASGPSVAQAQADVRAGGNSVHAEGQASLTADGSADHWQAELQAPALQALAPLMRLLPSLAPWQPAGGALRGRLEVQGRWPAVASTGDVAVDALKAGPLSVAKASTRWRIGRTADAPLEISAGLEQAAHGEQKLDHLQAQVQGTLRQHHLEVRADSSVRPPAWSDALLGASTAKGSAATLVADGAWVPAPDGGHWDGRVQRVMAAPIGADASKPWLSAENLQLGFAWNGAGLQRASAAPGRLALLGGALRWDQLLWQAGTAGAPPRIDVQARLEPLRVAPLLARLQPDFGWGGDLAVEGHVKVATGTAFHADVVIERRGGDLSVTDEGGTQTLGLTDLRLGLAADGGVWHFTEALAGSTVGVLAGAQSLRLDPRDVWPDPRTPLEGVLELRVDNLGVWGAWTPPGWRLAGTLHTSATLGGRFDAPEYTGRLDGRGIGARNLLLGVNVTAGDVAIALKGPTAQIERFTLQAGEGRLQVEGGASFGDQPRADLSLHARRFELLGRVDRRIVTSGEATLALLPQSLKLDGRFQVDEGLFDFSRSAAPTLDDDVTVVRPAPPDTEPKPPPRAPRQTQLALAVDLGERLHVRGRGLDTFLRGELRMTTPGGRLAVNGAVRSVNGTYQAYGQKLDIERGVLDFVGPVENPRLDILALRPNLDVRVGVTVNGPALDPRVRLYAEPEMSDNDKLSWLVLGRAPEGLGKSDSALLQRAAMALLAGEGDTASDKVLRTLGLDDFSVRQEGEGDVRNTIVALGKQVSNRWYLGYERGVNSTTGTWQAIYRIAQRFTLRAQAGEDNALDLIWTWRWN